MIASMNEKYDTFTMMYEVMETVTINGAVLRACDELLDTVVIDIHGKEYIRTTKCLWEEYHEPILVFRKYVKEEEIKKTRKPKRPPTDYNKFLKEALKSLSEFHPEMLCKDRMKIAAQQWRALARQ